MTTGLTDAMNVSQRTGIRDRVALEGKFQTLLQSMLTPIYRSHDAPLQFQIDSGAIVNAALRAFLATVSVDQPALLQDWHRVTSVFDILIERALLDEVDERKPPSDEQNRTMADERYTTEKDAAEKQNAVTNAQPLVVWLEHFYTVVYGVNPRAVEIVGRRVEGCTIREVAEQLELPLRLVQRIIQDVQRAWNRVSLVLAATTCATSVKKELNIV